MSVRRWFGCALLCVLAGAVQAQSPDYFVVKGTPITPHRPVSWAQCPPGHALRSGGFHGDDVFAMPEESAPDNTPPHQNSWRVKATVPGAAYAVCDQAAGGGLMHRTNARP